MNVSHDTVLPVAVPPEVAASAEAAPRADTGHPGRR